MCMQCMHECARQEYTTIYNAYVARTVHRSSEWRSAAIIMNSSAAKMACARRLSGRQENEPRERCA